MFISCVIMYIHMHKKVVQEKCEYQQLLTLLCIPYTNTSFAWSYSMFCIICSKYVTAQIMNFLFLKNQNIRWY